MNWEAISTVTEIVGIFLILASMTYVARQLRQNTSMMRVNASEVRLERDFELVLPIIESHEFAEIWLKSDKEFDDLDAADKQRILFFERRAISMWHHMYQLRMQNLLPDASWHEQTWVIQNVGRRSAVRLAWRLFKGGFDPPFQEFIDDIFLTFDEGQAHP